VCPGDAGQHVRTEEVPAPGEVLEPEVGDEEVPAPGEILGQCLSDPRTQVVIDPVSAGGSDIEEATEEEDKGGRAAALLPSPFGLLRGAAALIPLACACSAPLCLLSGLCSDSLFAGAGYRELLNVLHSWGLEGLFDSETVSEVERQRLKQFMLETLEEQEQLEAINKNREQLLQNLEHHGFQEVEIQGDGHCQFGAVADQVDRLEI
jgi:hypothetical protein